MNQLYMEILSKEENELVVRTALIAFLLPLNPTNDELLELKTICAEAVVNAIVHAYPNEEGFIMITIRYENRKVELIIEDEGIGMEDIDQYRTTFFSTKANEEHSGMGFTIMESFSDEMKVESEVGMGTTITLIKQLHDIQ